MTTPWPDEHEAHEAAVLVGAALAALGVPTSELAALGPRSDAAGRPVVQLPPLSVASTNQLLAALGPALGPHFAMRLPRAVRAADE